MGSERDPKEYYAALGVSLTAKPEEIKAAYRSLAKLWHPDRNKSPTAKEQFQRINDAYEVLSNPDKRERYDRESAEEAAAAAPKRQTNTASASAATSSSPFQREQAPQPVACCRCGTITAQPRLVTFWSVYSLLLYSVRQRHEGILCRACADKVALKASLKTWLLGWWAIPRGPFHTLEALSRNLMGGEQPLDENARLLGRQALAFAANGNLPLARATLDQAVELVRDRALLAELMHFQAAIGGSDTPHQLKNRWRPTATSAFYIQLIPFFLLFLLVFMGINSLIAPRPVSISGFHAVDPIDDTPSVSAPKNVIEMTDLYVDVDALPLFQQAQFSAPILETMPRFTSLKLMSVKAGDPFAMVQTKNAQIGFAATSALKTGDGATARATWCAEGAKTPATRAMLLNKAVSGDVALWFRNELTEDILLKLRNASGEVVLSLFVQKGVTTEVTSFAEGAYALQIASGKKFSPRCGRFLENGHFSALNKPETFLNNYTDAKSQRKVISYALTKERLAANGIKDLDQEGFEAP